MKNLNLLIVEGNLQKENDNFSNSGIQTHAESLQESLSYYNSDLNIEVFNSHLQMPSAALYGYISLDVKPLLLIQ